MGCVCGRRHFVVFMTFLGMLIAIGSREVFTMVVTHILGLEEAEGGIIKLKCRNNSATDFHQNWPSEDVFLFQTYYFVGTIFTQIPGGILAARFAPRRTTMSETQGKESTCMTICPLCKDQIKKGMRFDEHVVKCAQQRESCKICNKSFKKKEYLTRHLKLSHNEKCSEKEFDRNPDSDGEWKTQEEISLSDDDEKTNKESEEIEVGRLFRKRTNPNPVVNPVNPKKMKEKVEEKVKPKIKCSGKIASKGLSTTQERILKKIKAKVNNKFPCKKIAETVTKPDSDSSTEEDIKIPEYRVENKEAENHVLELKFNVEKSSGEKLKRNMEVKVDDEIMLGSVLMLSGKFEANQEFKLSDFVGDDVNLRSGDVKVGISEGKLRMTVNYK